MPNKRMEKESTIGEYIQSKKSDNIEKIVHSSTS